MSEALDTVRRALDERPDPSRELSLWIRDDDAVAATPELKVFLDQMDVVGAAPLLAVIPERLQDSLTVALERRSAGSVWVGVHGSAHRNHAPPDEKKSEYPDTRSQDDVLAELKAAWVRTRSALPHHTLPIFVPPWNRISATAVACLPQAGFLGLSTFADKHLSVPVKRIIIRNTDIDVIDWTAGRLGKASTRLTAELAREIASDRYDQHRRPLGILTHHRDHDEAVRVWLGELADVVAREPRLSWSQPTDTFGLVNDGEDWRRASR